jgi:DNA replication regulator DPB11
MGAEHQLDLTSDVTHLLVGDINTPKYKYVAKEREDVKVLSPDWVEAVRESWMKGGDTDVEALEREYRLPTFEGLSICLTGFDDRMFIPLIYHVGTYEALSVVFRTQLQNDIIKNGGHYTGDLTKSVSHLIARVPEGKKYVYAGQWNIKIVSLRWFVDSLQRGMVLEETLYHPTTPEADQGIGAWNRLSPRPSQLGKRARDAEQALNPARKLRRTASAKLGSQNEGIWTDIVGGVFVVQPQEDEDGQWDDSDRPMKPHVRPKSMIMEPKSFASDTTVTERRDSMVATRDQLTPPESVPTSRGFLYGRTFFIYGFTGRQVRSQNGLNEMKSNKTGRSRY